MTTDAARTTACFAACLTFLNRQLCESLVNWPRQNFKMNEVTKANATHPLEQSLMNERVLATSILNEWNPLDELLVSSWACWILINELVQCSIVSDFGEWKKTKSTREYKGHLQSTWLSGKRKFNWARQEIALVSNWKQIKITKIQEQWNQTTGKKLHLSWKRSSWEMRQQLAIGLNGQVGYFYM